MDQQRLDGRIAIVTGGGAGIGAASAMALAQAGATVVVNHRPRDSSREAAEKQVAAIAEQGGSAVAMAADVSDEAQIEALFAQTIERFGKLDILVNNAGVEKPADFDQMTLADWKAVMDVNLTG
ncbi:MAG: SDR family NAD(P)-dependent oxidoreductase, partial [Achromobacter sp.]